MVCGCLWHEVIAFPGSIFAPVWSTFSMQLWRGPLDGPSHILWLGSCHCVYAYHRDIKWRVLHRLAASAIESSLFPCNFQICSLGWNSTCPRRTKAIRPPYFSGCIWAIGFSFMIAPWTGDTRHREMEKNTVGDGKYVVSQKRVHLRLAFPCWASWMQLDAVGQFNDKPTQDVESCD